MTCNDMQHGERSMRSATGNRLAIVSDGNCSITIHQSPLVIADTEPPPPLQQQQQQKKKEERSWTSDTTTRVGSSSRTPDPKFYPQIFVWIAAFYLPPSF